MSVATDRGDEARDAGESVRGTARAGDVRIVYQSRGTGPALVCCHAFAVDRTMWAEQVGRFAQTHRVVCFDQRGSGESDHPVPAAGEADPYTIDTFADDVRAVLDDLEIPRARILGLSMGGATALRFATRWPERVETLILASTMASRLPEKIILRARVVEDIVARGGLREAFRYYFNGPLFAGVQGDSRFQAQIAAWAAIATPHGFLGNYRVTIDRPSMIGDLDRIHAPTLILVGERDTYYLEDAERMARAIRGARKVIMKGLGHAMSTEAPEAFADEVMGFLASVPAGS